MLSLYRRHLKSCPHKPKGRAWKRCKCPIWVDGTHQGIDIRESLKTSSWEEAEILRRQLEESPSLEIEKPKTVAEACTSFLADAKARHLEEDTIRKQRNILGPLQEFLEKRGKTYLKQITFEDLSDFRASWYDQALSSKKKLERMRGFFGYCERAGWIPNSPARGLKAPKVDSVPTLPFTPEEVTRMIAACDRYQDNYQRTGKPNARRLRALVLVLRYTGMRIRDAIQLSEDKVLPGRIFLYQQKTGEPVYVPIPKFMNDELAAVPGRTSETYYFWSGKGLPKSAVSDWQRAFRKLFKLAKVEGAHPHRFRDTFAVELLLKGVPMEDVSILLGHTSIKTTERSYSPWVRARQDRLEQHVRTAWGADIFDLDLSTPDVRGAKEVIEPIVN